MYGPVIYCSLKPMILYDLYTTNACFDWSLHFLCVVSSLKKKKVLGHLFVPLNLYRKHFYGHFQREKV